MTMRQLAGIAALGVLCGCGGASEDAADDAGSGAADTTEDADAAVIPDCNLALGAPCLRDEQCQSGLCLVSELTPFGICTVECTEAPNFCTTVDGESVPRAWCVEYPAEFKVLSPSGGIGAFCVPMCDELSECLSISPAWEECSKPTWQGQPLYGEASLNRSVCQAPSAAGKTPVDPLTCADWDTANPGFFSEKTLCENYCSFLSACQYYEPGHNLECCEWYCFLELVQGQTVVGTYEDVLVNFWQWFVGNPGTAQQCLGEQQYGPPPIPDSKAPDPATLECN
jgi:hypothetical protein